MDKLKQCLTIIDESIAAALAAATALVLFTGVVGRYFLGLPMAWVGELSILLLVWMVLWGAAMGYRRGSAIVVDTLIHALSPAFRRYLKVGGTACSALFLVSLAWYGCKALLDQWPYRNSVLGFTEGLYFIPLVLAAAEMLVQAIILVVAAAGGDEVSTQERQVL